MDKIVEFKGYDSNGRLLLESIPKNSGLTLRCSLSTFGEGSGKLV